MTSRRSFVLTSLHPILSGNQIPRFRWSICRLPFVRWTMPPAHNASDRSLVILDEIGRGTSTFDGLSIAWSVAEFLHDKIGARTLFATHYHELTDLSRSKEGIQNYNIAVREWNDQIIFLRKIVAGAADKSYGIQVARLAGLPGEIVSRAKEILTHLEDNVEKGRTNDVK